jgi:hypothetical protein
VKLSALLLIAIAFMLATGSSLAAPMGTAPAAVPMPLEITIQSPKQTVAYDGTITLKGVAVNRTRKAARNLVIKLDWKVSDEAFLKHADLQIVSSTLPISVLRDSVALVRVEPHKRLPFTIVAKLPRDQKMQTLLQASTYFFVRTFVVPANARSDMWRYAGFSNVVGLAITAP